MVEDAQASVDEASALMRKLDADIARVLNMEEEDHNSDKRDGARPLSGREACLV